MFFRVGIFIDSATRVQFLYKAVDISDNTDTLVNYHPFNYELLVGQTRRFQFDIATDLGEWIQCQLYAWRKMGSIVVFASKTRNMNNTLTSIAGYETS